MTDLPDLGDPRLDLLVAIYAEAALNIQRSLDELLIATGTRRYVIYQRILRELESLTTQTDAWSAQFIASFLDGADKAAVAALVAAGSLSAFNAIDPVAVEALTSSLTGHLSKARASISQLATKIFRSPALEREFPALAQKVRRQVGVGLAEGVATADMRARIANLLRPTFQSGLVSVIGKGGKRYTFPLDFYAGMVASATHRQARSVATLYRAREANHDLVRVTPNPSKTGDWCDAYRGRVFSISGAHPIYPPLASTPNGGPPFHPWCRHSLGIFVESMHSPAERAEVAKVDPRFLVKPNEDNPNRVAREWWAAKKNDTAPAPLRFN